MAYIPVPPKPEKGSIRSEIATARVIQVIETKCVKGTGKADDECRIVKQYWDFEGKLLAEYDPVSNENVAREDAHSYRGMDFAEKQEREVR